MALIALGTAGLEYVVGRRVGVPGPVLASRVSGHLKRGGVLSQKVGQLIASRPDIVDDVHLLKELRSLQSVETAPGVFEASIAIVQIDPVAGTATKRLRSATVAGDGTKLEFALHASKMLSLRVPQMAVITDALQTLIQELDLEGELKKNVMFVDSLAGCRTVQVPTTLTATADEVVMEYVPCILAKDVQQPPDLEVVNAFFREIVLSAVSSGVLHLDLHSGNVGVSLDGRRIVVYDMGSIRQVNSSVTCKACIAFVGAAEFTALGEWELLADHLVRKGIVVSVRDVANLKLMASVALQYSSGDATSTDIGRCMQTIKGDVNLDQSVFQLLQCVSILEGTCKVLNPAFNIAGAFTDSAFFLKMGDILERALMAS